MRNTAALGAVTLIEAQARLARPLIRSANRGGTPIVRVFWEDFLSRNRQHLRGHALEIDTDSTLRHWGGGAITKTDVLDLEPGPGITIVADLTKADAIPSDTFDVFLNQFTMHIIEDDRAALHHSIRVLKPGGVLICNFGAGGGFAFREDGAKPYAVQRWYTPAGVRALLHSAGLAPQDYEIATYGSAYAYVATFADLDVRCCPKRWQTEHDPRRPLLIAVRATKPAQWAA